MPPRGRKAVNMITYITLAISDMMFPDDCSLTKKSVSAGFVRGFVRASEDIVSILNPSHTSTIGVIKRKFDIDLPIPEKAPKVSLQSGDQLIVLQAQLPRLAEGEVHSQETVENAAIKFSLWKVQ